MSGEGQDTQPSYAVRWLVSPLHRLEITSSLVAGFASLAKRGDLELSLTALNVPGQSPHIMRLNVRDLTSGDERRLAFDEFDRMDRFDSKALAEVDVYFKRSFSQAATGNLAESLRSKVQPSGITFGCYLPGSRRLMLRAALVASAARVSVDGLSGLKPALALLLHNASQVEGLLQASAFERLPSDPLSERVVFQTRIWPDDPDPTVDRRSTNADRIALVQALRSEFGGSDIIGLLPTDFASKNAPGAVLSRKVSRAEYAQQLRTSRVAVNSRGLDGAAGFKVGESLAAGCALVSEPFQFQLPEPLLPGVNYLPFETPEECVEQCRRLLDDREMADEMSRQNQEYYARNVRPEAHARSLLARAFLTGQ